MIMTFFMGLGMIVQMAACNTILQSIVKEDKRGRVMSLYAMAFAGMTPFGSLLIGVVSSRIGPPHAVVINGIACILGTLWLALRFQGIHLYENPK